MAGMRMRDDIAQYGNLKYSDLEKYRKFPDFIIPIT
jgi:hypothetical protein